MMRPSSRMAALSPIMPGRRSLMVSRREGGLAASLNGALCPKDLAVGALPDRCFRHVVPLRVTNGGEELGPARAAKIAGEGL